MAGTDHFTVEHLAGNRVRLSTPAKSARRVLKRWHFEAKDGSQYEVIVAGPGLLTRLLRRSTLTFKVIYATGQSTRTPDGKGFSMRGTDGWLGVYYTFDLACSAAQGFVDQNKYTEP